MERENWEENFDWLNCFDEPDPPKKVYWVDMMNEYLRFLHPHCIVNVSDIGRTDEWGYDDIDDGYEPPEEFRDGYEPDQMWWCNYVVNIPGEDETLYYEIEQSIGFLKSWYEQRHRREKLLKIKSKML